MKLGETILNDYWMKYYVDVPGPEGRCTLCGNSGIIDTRGVKDVCGNDVGRLNYCICPNGQEMRAVAETIDPDIVAPRPFFSRASIEVLGALNQHIRDVDARNKKLEWAIGYLQEQIGEYDRDNKRLIAERDGAHDVVLSHLASVERAELTARKWKRYYHELLTRVSSLQSVLDRVEFVDPKRAERYDKMEKEAA